MTHNDLIDLGIKWLIKPYASLSKDYGHASCPVILTELSAYTVHGETPDVLGFCTRRSILIECKMSRSDFYADLKKPFRRFEDFGIGNQRWYLAPEGIVPVERVPEKWGLLEVVHGKKIRVTKRPVLQNKDFQSEVNMLVSAMRRLNIMPDGHVSIKKFEDPEKLGFKPSKNKATFYVRPESEEKYAKSDT